MCIHYDPREATKQCHEDDAEEVNDKMAANFCEYFKPNPEAFDPTGFDAEQRAAQELESLFADDTSTAAATPDASEEALRDAEALFRK